uniref:Uncharacterized protein n=1 Tax=Amphimedon queenslandica TaxID=400682 RepID=A0A1X7VRD2_AMPQE
MSDENDYEGDYLTSAAKHQALDYNDNANVAGNAEKLSSSAKYNILQYHFEPDRNHIFPQNSNGHSFQYKWLQEFPWLAYSLQENGGYRINCVLFCISEYHGSFPGDLVTKPLTSFHKALEILRKHYCTFHHKESVNRCECFVRIMAHQQLAISTVLNQQMADQVALDKRKRYSFFKVIALRGHRNSVYMVIVIM